MSCGKKVKSSRTGLTEHSGKSLVTVVDRENFVFETYVFDDEEDASDAFTQECQTRGVDPCDVDYQSGYIHLEDDTLISVFYGYNYNEYIQSKI